MDQEMENKIIGTVYDAALDASLWPEVIRQIVEFTQSKTAVLTALDRLNPNYDFEHAFNIPQAGLDAYHDEQVRLIDMALHIPLWQQQGIGGVINQDLNRYAQLSNSDEFIFYEKCLKVTGISYIAGVLLDHGEYRWSVLGIHRASEQPAFAQEELDFLKRIGVHIRRALQIHKQLSFARIENKNLYRVLDAIKVGIILIDEKRTLYYANQRAQQLLEHSKIFEFDAQNRIFMARMYQQKFERLIQTTLLESRTNTDDIGGVLAVNHHNGQQFMLTATPFSSIERFENLKDKNYAVLFISEVGQQYALATPYLKEIYTLSPRECEICELFVNGSNLEKIAVHCNLTLSSVRTYVKNIYGKLQCNSQAELLHKLMGMTINFEHVC